MAEDAAITPRISVRRAVRDGLAPNTIVLTPIAWDDWFKYSTLYDASYIDSDLTIHEVGSVKIALQGMARDQQHPLSLGEDFEEQPTGIYSVGQSEEYYSSLFELDGPLRDGYTRMLGDIVAHPERIDRYADEDVMGDSLLRFVSTSSLAGEFRRALRGSTALNQFTVTYRSDDLDMEFHVDPDSQPRSNIHAIIGRNGVGKSFLMRNISRALLFNKRGPETPSLQAFDEDGNDEGVFAGVAFLTFSAFETFMPSQTWFNRPGIHFTYIGLRSYEVDESDHAKKKLIYRTPGALWQPFHAAATIIQKHNRSALWQETLEFLRGDPVFEQLDMEAMTRADADTVKSLFNELSDGHKSVLLSVTLLVANVEERTLVVMDEPEAHLHPPLLSALTRALSHLLRKRNAFAIMATHSPVILQEIPKSCAWILEFDGWARSAIRPEFETYGEDVATLTHEVFQLEVARSSYHRELQALADDGLTYAEALDRLGGSLGMEGRSILRSLCLKNER